MGNVCINLRIQDFEKLANFCKATSYTKKDIILKAIDWQFDNTDTYSVTYQKSRRRTVYVNITEDEHENIKRLAEFMNCTPAQAGLISVRNFLGASEDGAHDFFSSATKLNASENFIASIPHDVYEVVIKSKMSGSKMAMEALEFCKDLDNIAQVTKRSKGIQSPGVRIILKDEKHIEILSNLMKKFNEKKGKIIARALATHLLNPIQEGDLELF